MPEIKVTHSEGEGGQTASTLDITSDLDVPDKIKSKIKRDIGEFLVEKIREAAAQSKSLVSGERIPALSAAYKKHKTAEGLPGQPNLEFTGALMDGLTFKPTDEGIALGWFDMEQAEKADGHLKFSGRDNNLPKRRILPAEGQRFKADVQREIEQIVADAVSDAIDIRPSDLYGIASKQALYEYLKSRFDGFSRPEIRMAVLGNPELVSLLEDADLLDLL